MIYMQRFFFMFDLNRLRQKKKIPPATSRHILKVGFHGNISHYNKHEKKLKADILLA